MVTKRSTGIYLCLVLASCFQLILSGKIIDECTEGKNIAEKDKALLTEYKVAEDPEAQCVQVCIVTKAKWLNEDGTVNMPEIQAKNKEILQDEKREAAATEIVENCVKGQLGDTPCAKGVSVFRCVIENYVAGGFSDLLEKSKDRLSA